MDVWFYNLRVTSFELRVTNRDFKRINVQILASCKAILRVANLFCDFEIK